MQRFINSIILNFFNINVIEKNKIYYIIYIVYKNRLDDETSQSGIKGGLKCLKMLL